MSGPTFKRGGSFSTAVEDDTRNDFTSNTCIPSSARERGHPAHDHEQGNPSIPFGNSMTRGRSESPGRLLRSLYRICGRESILPKFMQIPFCYDQSKTPLCSGGSSDMWKGMYEGKEVAAKVLRTYASRELDVIRKVGFPLPVMVVN